MITVPTFEKLKSMKFWGMAQAFEEQMSSSQYERLSFEERLGLLVDREASERENRRMQSRLKQAALRQQACIQDIDHTLPRGLDPALMQSLYSGQWIKEHLNILICGPTGIGKSFIACALGHQACLQGARVKYLRIPRLLPQLALARGDGSYLKMINQMARMDLIILDDWGLSVFNDQERRDILEILDDRHNRGSTIITAQLPVEKWHQIIGDPTLADAILDRVVHNAYKLQLKGDSVRKKRSKLTNAKQ